MRIGFDAKRLFNNFTGLGNYSRFVVEALAKHHPQNEYWLYTPKLKSHPETAFYREAGRFIISQPAGWARTFSSLWRTYALGKVAGRDGVQIFHGLSNELPVTKPDSLRTVLTVHDLIFKRFPQYYNPIDVRIYGWKLKSACVSADRIVAVSHQTASDLREFMQVPADKISVIHQGCHPIFKQEAAVQQREEVRNKYRLPANYVLFVGTLEERKNALQLVRALTQMKHKVPLVLVGRATRYVDQLKALIQQHQIETQVLLLHAVAFADLPAVYQMASLFVYPSVFEGFGIPIVEAIVSGVPVITSRGSCFDEAGGPATRYVNPANSQELASTMDELLGDASLRAEMVRRSQEYVSRFEPAVIADLMMKEYQNLV